MPTTRTYLDYLNEKVDIAPANSQEELEAAEMLGSLMQEHGLEVQMQDFDTPAWGKLAHYVLHIVMFVGMLLSGFINTPVGLVGMLLAVAAFALLMLERTGRDYISGLGPRARSQNVIGVHRASGPLVMKGNRPVVIVAHYDTPNEGLLHRPQVSKYQPLVYRLCFPCSIAVAACAFFQILGFVPEGFRHLLLVVGLIAGLPLLATGVAAVYSRFAPCTEGANDNKASVAALLGVMDMVRPANDEAKSYLALHPHVAPERIPDPAAYVPGGYDQAPVPAAAPIDDSAETSVPVADDEPMPEGAPLPADELPISGQPLPEEPYATEESFVSEPAQAPALDASFEPAEPVPADIESALAPAGVEDEPAPGLTEIPMIEPEAVPASDGAPQVQPESESAAVAPAERGDLFDGNVRRGADFVRSLSILPEGCEIVYAEPELPELDLSGLPEVPELPVFDPVAMAHGESGVTQVPAAQEATFQTISPDDVAAAQHDEQDAYDDQPSVTADDYAEQRDDDGFIHYVTYDEQVPIAEVEPYDEAAAASEPYDEAAAAGESYDEASAADAPYDEAATDEPYDESAEPYDGVVEAPLDVPLPDTASKESPLSGLKAAWGRVVDGFKNRGASQQVDAVVEDDYPQDDYPQDDAYAQDDYPQDDAYAQDDYPQDAPADEERPIDATAAITDGTGEVIPFKADDDADSAEAPEPAVDDDGAAAPDSTRPMPASGIEVDPSAGTTAAANPSASKTLVDEFASDARAVESIPSSDDEAPAAEKSVDPHATVAMSALTFSTEQDVPEEELEGKDVTGLDTLSVDGLNLKRPAEERVKPAAIEDPSWGKSDFRPPQQSLGRRAILFDLPDPSRETSDPFVSDPDATAPEGRPFPSPAAPAPAPTPEPTSEPAPQQAVEPEPAPAPQDGSPQPDKLEVIHGASAPAPVVPTTSKPRGLRSLFGRKKKEEVDSMSDWLGVEDDYDAKKNGREIGNWKNFENDGDGSRGDNGGWKGGATRRSGLRDDAAGEPAFEDAPIDQAPADVPAGAPYADAPYDEQGFEAAPFDEVVDASSSEPQPAPAEYLTPEEAAAQQDVELAPAPSDDDLREAILGMSDDELLAHDIWFVATGASSLDHAGIKKFLDEHRKDIRGAFVVNLECVGAGKLTILSQEGEATPRRADRRMGRLLLNIAKDLHIDLDHARFDWADTEATPAMRSRTRATTVIGLDENGVPALSHTPDDIEANIDPDRPTRVAEMIAELIRRA